MLLNNLKFLEKTKLKLVSKVFPFKRTEVVLLDKLDIAISETKINQITISAILSPDVTHDFCPVRPEINELEILLEGQTIEDLTIWLREQLSYPGIESFSPLLNIPKKAGKSYQETETESEQLTLFGEDADCIHGLKKSWCSICIGRERQDRKRDSSRVNPFDLIFPILQPPLGENFDSPIAFSGGKELYPFQRIGVKFLVEHERALLGDEMGLGKSIQAITAIRFLVRMGKITNSLILCPKSVLTDWGRKLWDWAPELRVVKVRGPKEQRQIYWNSPAHIYLTTYETLRQDMENSLSNSDTNVNSDGSYTVNCPNDECSQRLRMDKEIFGIEVQCPTCHHIFSYTPAEDIAKKQFDIVILDEIQKIKNPGAITTKATRMVDANLRWGLSGTPLENRVEEIISIFAYLKPGLLHYDDASRPQKIKESIKPYFLRRKVEVLPEFPKVAYDEVWLELSPTQRESYDRAEQEGVVALNEQGDSITVQHILALITKLKQICNIDPVSKESCKIEYLLEKLEEISDSGDKSLVFSQYPEKTLRFLEPELLQFNPSVYRGPLSDSQRDKIVDEFQNQEACKVILMSVKAGGLGITLTRANHVFHLDQWWNPAVTDQATARARRIGQKKTVFVTSLFTEDTIEKRIQNLLARKRELFKTVIDDLSDTNLSKVLTKDELFSLFNLQKAKPTIAKGMPKSRMVTIESLRQISPQQFEKLIADLYEKMGYQVRLTSQTRDQGIDVFAKRVSESGTESLAIQCKHFPMGTVGVEHARSLYGVIQDQPSITRGVLITTGGFSKECKEFTKGKRIELFDGKYLCGLLEKYNTPLSEETK